MNLSVPMPEWPGYADFCASEFRRAARPRRRKRVESQRATSDAPTTDQPDHIGPDDT